MGSWKKIDSSWKRILSVVALVTTLSTITVTITGWEIPKVTACYVLAGLVILFAGWMLDDHVKEFEKTNEKNETRFNHFEEVLHEIREHILETHKDTVRIQLQQQIQHKSDNIDTILKLAEKYFCELKGDWFMTNEFVNWAEAHGIDPKIVLTCKVERHD